MEVDQVVLKMSPDGLHFSNYASSTFWLYEKRIQPKVSMPIISKYLHLTYTVTQGNDKWQKQIITFIKEAVAERCIMWIRKLTWL